ncbi:MAG TPA: serine/threonine-protein kinase [Gemmataceae bacterium]|jgi:serine/threonine protein kinase|nr:serine/threonine-protein kinase [Gemmataceae bacterium]
MDIVKIAPFILKQDMPGTPESPPVLLKLAVEGIRPVMDGCAGTLAHREGPGGVAVAQATEKAINFFGGRIVERWQEWFRQQPDAARQAALVALAQLSDEHARDQAKALLHELAPIADAADVSIALEYLAAIPRTVNRVLLFDSATQQHSISISFSFDEPQALMQLLPVDVPPYAAPATLSGTPYRLEQLLGMGGFGAVYRASATGLQHLPLAIKFCLDPSMVRALQLERDNLERLMKAGGEAWSKRIVRLYGYDLNYHSPYLVYEYIRGGDLLQYLGRKRRKSDRGLAPEEILPIIVQISEALAFAHQHGLVHRDLKPANILVDGDTLKLADFGLGSVSVKRAIQASRIGATTISLLTANEQASLFRGAGTPLYMSPEQRLGAEADPKNDLYSLGVIWFQLLAGDTTRELHAGWAKELVVRHQVPQQHIGLIEQCVGWYEERPKDGSEFLKLLHALPTTPEATAVAAVAVTLPPRKPASLSDKTAPGWDRREQLLSRLRQLQNQQQRGASAKKEAAKRRQIGISVVAVAIAFLILMMVAIALIGMAMN